MFSDTCMTLVSSIPNFWSFRFTIDEYMITRVSKLQVRLHQTQDKCNIYRVFLLQAMEEVKPKCSYKASDSYKHCELTGYDDNTDTSNGGYQEESYCLYNCFCTSDAIGCSNLLIVMTSALTHTSELCSITWYMDTTK